MDFLISILLDKIRFTQPEDIYELLKCCKIQLYEPGEIITEQKSKENDTSEKLVGFVISGLVKSNIWNEDTEKGHLSLSESGMFFASASIVDNNPYLFSIEAIKKSECITIAYEVLAQIAATNHRLAISYIKILEELLISVTTFMTDFMTRSPEERYMLLAENKPHLLKDLSRSELASLLGIAPESLSRMKKRLIKAYSA